jgi:hypothetical protein
MNIEESLNAMDEKAAAEGEQPDFEVPTDEEGAVEEKKRLSINPNTLLLFGLLAAVGGATYLMCWRAGAQTTNNVAASSAATTISTFLNGGQQHLQQMIVMLRETEKVVKQFDLYPSAAHVPLSDLRTNPFRSTVAAQVSVTPLSDDAVKRSEEDEKQAAQQIASGLKLESLVVGSRSMCMINGKTYREGQGNDSFTVQKITSHGVWVIVGSVRAEVTMAPPRVN